MCVLRWEWGRGNRQVASKDDSAKTQTRTLQESFQFPAECGWGGGEGGPLEERQKHLCLPWLQTEREMKTENNTLGSKQAESWSHKPSYPPPVFSPFDGSVFNSYLPSSPLPPSLPRLPRTQNGHLSNWNYFRFLLNYIINFLFFFFSPPTVLSLVTHGTLKNGIDKNLPTTARK